MKSIILLAICFLSLTGCRDKNLPPFIVDLTIDIQYFDSEHNNLLDQESPIAYKFDSMQHYYIDNDIKKIIDLGWQSSYPKEMHIFKDFDTTPAILRIFPHIETYENGLRTFTDIIKFNAVDEDTIISEIEITNNTRVIKKVLYNNNLVYTYGVSPGRNFVIYK